MHTLIAALFITVACDSKEETDLTLASACESPTAVTQTTDAGEVPTGFVECADGLMHRETVETCPSVAAPEDAAVCASTVLGTAYSTCNTAADCTESVNGHCVDAGVDGLTGEQLCGCQYGCNSDADCTEYEVCACAGVYGTQQCIRADCKTDDDCEEGLCALTDWGWCAYLPFTLTCTTPEDTCRLDEECEGLVPDSPHEWCGPPIGGTPRECNAADPNDNCSAGPG